MKKILIAALALAAVLPLAAKSKAKAPDFKICSYVNANWVKGNYDFERLSHVNRIYVFGLSPDENGGFYLKDSYVRGLEAILEHLDSKQQKLLTLGGGATVREMLIMGTDPEKRAAFIKEAVALADKYGFDGIDVDWESSTKAGRKYTQEELVTFVKELREALPQGKMLTATLSRRTECARHAAAILPYVDDISVMIYSHVEKKDRKLAPLWVVQEVMKWYADAGVPADRLIPGVPFYGIHQSMADGKPRKNKVYSLIEPTLPAGDMDINVTSDGYAFNSYSEMKEKTQWMLSSGYRGIMIWEISQDAPYSCKRSLLRAINDGLGVKQKAPAKAKKEKAPKAPKAAKASKASKAPKTPVTLTLSFSDGTKANYPFESPLRKDIGNSWGKDPVNIGITDFVFRLNGVAYAFKTYTTNDIVMNTIRGLRMGTGAGDYVQFPAIEGMRIVEVTMVSGTKYGSGIPCIADKNGNVIAGGDAHRFKEEGESFSWTLTGTAPGEGARLLTTTAKPMEIRELTVRYE